MNKVPSVSLIRSSFELLLLLGMCLCVTALQAQVDQGSISGTITDSSGAIVVGATVTLTDSSTNLTFSRVTNSAGQYTFAPLKIGNYNLKVAAAGFQTSVRDHIQVDVSSFVGLNIKLNPGAISEVVQVRADTELQTEDASTGQVFTSEQLNDSPLQSRNYTFLAQLTTGVNPPNQQAAQTSGSGSFSSNGSRISQNNFILDGVDNNSNMQDYLNGATYAVLPPPDALQEFKVQSSGYSAELGRGTGAAINASIKSGTNSVHGSLWEYFRSDRLTANDYFNRSGSTAYHNNVFGATLGGPVLKNKLFFFADGQGTRISQYRPEQPNNTVPTDAMRNGDFSEMLDANNTNGNGAIALYRIGGNITPTVGSSELAKDPSRYLSCPSASAVSPTSIPGQNVICPGSLNSIAQRILKLFPEPNQGAPHQVFQNYTIPATSTTSNTTQYDARIDFNPSAKDQAFGRYSYSNNPTNFAPPFPILDGGGFGTDGQNSNYAKSGVISETHFFSPTLTNEFRVGYNYLHASYLQIGSNSNIAAQYGLGGIPFGPSLGGFPDINFSDINGIGIPGYMPSDEKQNVIEFIDNVTKILGRHSIKIGVNVQHVRFFGLQTPNPTGSQNFTGTYTSDPGDLVNVSGTGVADFLLDQMNSSSINTNTPFTDLRYYDAAFIQDDYKVRPNLTLNLGFRWEYTQPFVELHDNQANFIGNYLGMNQGTGTLLIPESQRNYLIPPVIAQVFAKDNIAVKYTSNRSVLNPNYREFAPRLGFAYQPTPRIVLRGGFGFFYGGQENIGLGENLFNNPPFFIGSSYSPVPNQCYNTAATGVVCPTNGQTLETGFGAAVTTPNGLADHANLPSLFQHDLNAKSTYTEAYNLSLQQSITSDTSFTIGYQGNVTRHLQTTVPSNLYPGVVPQGANGQLYAPFYDLGAVNRIANGGIGNYNSLQAKIERRYSHGLYFLAGYTWAHSLDDATQPIQGGEGAGVSNVNFLGLRFNYGASINDIRNRFTLSPTYTLPFGQGEMFLNRGGVINQVAGGWKIAAIFQAQTGSPIAFNGLFRISNPFGSGGTPNPVTQHQVTCATKVRTLDHWFNPCAFAQAPVAILPGTATTQNENYVPLAQAGTLPYGQGRISITGPGFNRLDLSLFKTFPLEFHNTAVQLRADGFNVFNHPSYGDPNGSITGDTAGNITSTRYSGVLPDARTLQVAARLTF